MEDKLQMIAIDSLIDGGLELDFINSNFNKRKVISSNDIFEYNEAVRFVLDIGTQVSSIAEFGFSPIFLLHEHISRIDNTFIITNFDTFIPLKNGKLNIKTIFKKTKYMAPELLKADILPFTADIETIHYNIVKLCIQNLHIDNNIERLKPTKLYYLFKRVLSERREILYI